MKRKGYGKLLRKAISLFLCIFLFLTLAPDGKLKADENTAVYVGDVDGNGSIDGKDVTTLRRYVAGGWNVTVDEKEADINGDGEINSKDITMLRRYLAGGWGVELRKKTDQIEVPQVEINEDSFPNQNFRQYVLENIDSDDDGILSSKEQLDVSRISCNGLDIKDFKGIGYFKNLLLLECRDNNIESLDLSDNTSLEILYCDGNNLSGLELTNNTALTSISCSINAITSLDLSNNTLLKELNCRSNQIIDINLSKNQALEELYCNENQMTELELSKNIHLLRLDCGWNKIENLDLSQNSELEFLDCRMGSYLENLDLRNNDKLNLKNVHAEPEVLVLYATHDHDFVVDYEWSDDYRTCTAILTCSDEDCQLHKTELSKTRRIIKVQPTVEKKGISTYTAEFENELFSVQSIDVENIEKLTPDFADNIGKEYYYRQLTDAEKDIYDCFKSAAIDSNFLTWDNSYGLKMDELNSASNRAMSALQADYPKTKCIWSSGYSVSFREDKVIVERCDNKIFSASVLDKADKIAENIINAIPKGTDAYTTIRNLATYIESYTRYFLSASEVGGSYISTYLGVLIKKKGICSGYADTAKILFDKLNIPCVIVGNAEHAWNYVMLEDGKWYAIDLSIADMFSEYDDEMRDGFVTSNSFLCGSNDTNYNSAPYNVSELYLGNPGDFEFPVLNENNYEYSGDYSFDINEIEYMEEEGKFIYELNDDGETCRIVSYEGKEAGDLIIPESIDGYTVTEIGIGAFYSCEGFTGNLVIPESVVKIGNGAFESCSGLKRTLSLPSQLEVIDKYVFLRCYGLSGNLNLPENLRIIDEAAFSGCSSLTGNLLIPDSVEQIGQHAFSGCSGFTGDLRIPENTKEINELSFSGCSGLDGICYIHKGIEKWESNSTVLTNIKEFAVDEENEYFASVDGLLYDKGSTKLIACPSGKEGMIVIPESVTEICARACYCCRNITGVVLPLELCVVGDYAFFSCWNLSGELIIPEKVTTIGCDAFAETDGYTGFIGDLIIPDSVTSIGENAFSGNQFGGILKISKSISEIKEQTFMLNKFSGDLVIPDSVKSIGENAFGSQSNDNPTFIDGGKLILPASIEIIGRCAFMGAGLTGDINLAGVVVGENAFMGNNLNIIYE